MENTNNKEITKQQEEEEEYTIFNLLFFIAGIFLISSFFSKVDEFIDNY